jgi:hypothetical protein
VQCRGGCEHHSGEGSDGVGVGRIDRCGHAVPLRLVSGALLVAPGFVLPHQRGEAAFEHAIVPGQGLVEFGAGRHEGSFVASPAEEAGRWRCVLRPFRPRRSDDVVEGGWIVIDRGVAEPVDIPWVLGGRCAEHPGEPPELLLRLAVELRCARLLPRALRSCFLAPFRTDLDSGDPA